METPCDGPLLLENGLPPDIPSIDIDAEGIQSSVTTWADALAEYNSLSPTRDFVFRFWPGFYAKVHIDPAVFNWLPTGSLSFVATSSPAGIDPVILDGSAGNPDYGPVFNFDGISTAPSLIRIGFALDEDPSGWRGFVITHGYISVVQHTGVLEGGAGIRLSDVTPPVEVIGNRIIENYSAAHGGAIAARSCLGPLVIGLNEIDSNLVAFEQPPQADPAFFGAAIFIDGPTNARIIANHIHHNVFHPSWNVFRDRCGGGIAVQATLTVSDESTTVAICKNEIHSNNAAFGPGIYVHTKSSEQAGGFPRVHIDRNSIHDNEAWFSDLRAVPLSTACSG